MPGRGRGDRVVPQPERDIGRALTQGETCDQRGERRDPHHDEDPEGILSLDGECFEEDGEWNKDGKEQGEAAACRAAGVVENLGRRPDNWRRRCHDEHVLSLPHGDRAQWLMTQAYAANIAMGRTS